MKKLIATTTAVLVLVCLSTVSAHAGAARRHTVEGFMLGAGATILGAAIINSLNKDSAPCYVPAAAPNDGYRTAYKKRHHTPPASRGHWVVKKVWVPPVYETKWNPGHYNRAGKWIKGRYVTFMVKSGYWCDKRIWVVY